MAPLANTTRTRAVRDAAHTVLARKRLKVGVHHLPDLHGREVLLEHLAFDPHGAEIGHAI
jgi:hypothetical protein